MTYDFKVHGVNGMHTFNGKLCRKTIKEKSVHGFNREKEFQGEKDFFFVKPKHLCMCRGRKGPLM